MWKVGMDVPKTLERATIIDHKTLAPAVRQLDLCAPNIARLAAPGQFVHLRIGSTYDPLLRRPFSIAGVEGDVVRIIYRVVGRGTVLLEILATGDKVDCLGPLGRGFDLDCRRPLLVGGGMGLAPLVYLAQHLCPRPQTVLMGGRTSRELFWADIFRDSCDRIHITTDDSSLGQPGTVVDVLPELLVSGDFDMIYTCGPRPMMEKVAAQAKNRAIPCQVSLEEHMACGVGACLSCTCAGPDGKRRKICTDGPVFWTWEVFP